MAVVVIGGPVVCRPKCYAYKSLWVFVFVLVLLEGLVLDLIFVLNFVPVGPVFVSNTTASVNDLIIYQLPDRASVLSGGKLLMKICCTKS